MTRRMLARNDEMVVMRASLPPGTFDEAGLQSVPVGGLVVFRQDDPMHFARSGPEGTELLVVATPPESVEAAVLVHQ